MRSQHIRVMALLTLPLMACSVLTPSPGSTGAPVSADSPGSPSLDSPRAGSRAADSPELNEGNVVAILLAANDAQIKYAELALAKSRDAEIRKFALMTKFDHESVSGAVRDLATRHDIMSEDTELSTSQYARAVSMRMAFRDLEGVAFDSAYIANEVAFHRALLRTIDDVLLPTAEEVELETLLGAVRKAMAAHLSHAEVAARRPRRRI